MPQQKPAANDVFSGVVTELSPDALTVVRKALAKADVTRRFQIGDRTKVEGSLKVSARVTVSYGSAADGQLLALHILVR